jgi:hypothetical protein
MRLDRALAQEQACGQLGVALPRGRQAQHLQSGGGDVTRYVGRHGTARLARLVLVSAIPPGLLQTGTNPGGVPMAQLDGVRAAVAGDRHSSTRT